MQMSASDHKFTASEPNASDIDLPFADPGYSPGMFADELKPGVVSPSNLGGEATEESGFRTSGTASRRNGNTRKRNEEGFRNRTSVI